jgi:hypothetical protein
MVTVGEPRTSQRKDAQVRIHAQAFEHFGGGRHQAEVADPAPDEIAERERRRMFWQQFNESVLRLRANPDAWAAYQAELRGWDGTLLDGIPPAEDWSGVFDADTPPW